LAGLDGGPEHRAARVDLAQHHGDVGPDTVGVQGLPDAPVDFPLQVGAGRHPRPVLGPSPGHGLAEQVGQGVGPHRGEHADPGLGVAERWPEGGRAQHRQQGAGTDAAQFVAAVPRGAQQPVADTGLKPLDIIEIAH
jgi:hypothetical protein